MAVFCDRWVYPDLVENLVEVFHRLVFHKGIVARTECDQHLAGLINDDRWKVPWVHATDTRTGQAWIDENSSHKAGYSCFVRVFDGLGVYHLGTVISHFDHFKETWGRYDAGIGVLLGLCTHDGFNIFPDRYRLPGNKLANMAAE